MKNYKLSNFNPRNINHHAKNISPVPIAPQVSVWLSVPRAKEGNTPENPKNISVNTKNPPANRRNDKITINFVSGVQAI